MKKFWNETTAFLLGSLGIFISLYFIQQHYHLEIQNSITLAALIITVLTTLYSNYNSDKRVDKQIKNSEKQFERQLKENEKNLKEQLLFNKKQEIYSKLYNDLNNYWELLDYKRVNYYIKNSSDYEPTLYITYNDFSQIHKIMRNFNLSPDFLYMPNEIQKVTNKFLKYVDTFLEHYEYYKIDDSPNFHDAIEILSEIFPLLKKEIGLKR